MKILIALALVVGLAALWGLACVVVPQWLGALFSRAQQAAPSASATTDAFIAEQRSIAEAEAEQTLQEERDMHRRNQLEEELEAQRQSEIEEQESLALLMTHEHMA